MGDVGDDWNAIKDHRKAMRAKYGVPCPECVTKLPRAAPTILVPDGRCRIHKIKDERPIPKEMIGMFGA